MVVLTPKQYEEDVARILRASQMGLSDLNVTHREVIPGLDGEYEIDVVARFTALNAGFTVLVECKYHKNPVKREVVQILKEKLLSTGAQKGMIFSSAGFQSGAVEYAKKHGIALIHFQDGRTAMITNSKEPRPESPTRRHAVGWLLGENEKGQTILSIVSVRHPEKIDSFLVSEPIQ